MNQTIEVMKNHRCIRSFEDKDIPDAIIDELVSVAQAAPNSINGQQISLVIVRDKEKKRRIAEIAGGQTWIAQAPLFILFVADFYKAKLAANKVGRPLVIPESVEATIAVSIDAGICLGNVITAAESLDLGIVPIGGIRNDPAAMIELMNLPEYTFPINGLSIGYPADRSRQKPRMPLSAFRHDEVYDPAKLRALIDEYDALMEPYLKSVGRGGEVNWSTNTINFYSFVYFPKVYPVMKLQGFKNDK
jgi:FMN reductase [NAD(P)H]